MPNKQTNAQNRFRISVVTPCYNAESVLAETLDSLASQQCDEPWELVIVNNKSTDSSMQIAESYRGRIPNLRIVDANDGQGTAYSVNKGVKSAQSDFIVFCDSDDVPAPGWLAAMLHASRSNDFIACRMEVKKLNDKAQHGNRTTPQTKGLMRISYPPYLSHAGGSSLGIKRQIFLDMGGYDPTYIYLHETDFCFRTQLAGHKLSFVPDAVLSIRFRTNKWANFKQSFYWGAYNVLLYKNYRHLGTPPKSGIRRFYLDSKLVFKYLLRWATMQNGQKIHAAWTCGWYFGKLAGMIRYRSGPY